MAQPQTYMNLSGESVSGLISWYKIDLDHLIVVYDDCDLPAGSLRVREKGSAGTHNGMRSILYQLGSEDFPRVRVGIGRPPEGWELADYVLSPYRTAEERKTALRRAGRGGRGGGEDHPGGLAEGVGIRERWSKEGTWLKAKT